MSKRQRRRNRGLKKTTLVLGIAVAVVAIAIGVFQFASPLKVFLTPGQVDNVQADTCYSCVNLSWDAAKKAKEYKILENKGEGEPETVGFTKGETKFTIEDYDRDEAHEYTVVAVRKDPFNGKEYLGKESEPVEAYYDSSKYAQKVPVLAYHAVVSSEEEVNTSLAIKADHFDEQMKYLHDNGYTTLTLDEFRLWHAGKKELPPKSVLITFDDGDYGVYHFAYPIIKKYGQAATSFVIGHHIEDVTPEYGDQVNLNHYIGWDVIQKVREEYPRFEFESHTYDMHSRINGKMPVRVYTYEQKLEDAKANERFGFKYLAYPWGGYDEEMIKALKDSGYKMAFGYRPFYYALRDNNTFVIDRIKIKGAISLEKFIKIVSGENEGYDNPDPTRPLEDAGEGTKASTRD